MRKLTVDDSSNVRSVTLQNDSPGIDVLVVEFTSGASYSYHNCTQVQFVAACAAPSVGKWVQENLVRRPTEHPATRLAHVKVGQPVDGKLVALQVIASMPNPRAEQRSMVDAARAALAGRMPPPRPPGWPKPLIRDGRVTWPIDLEGAPGDFDGSLSPDEAEGIAYSLLAAALEARS